MTKPRSLSIAVLLALLVGLLAQSGLASAGTSNMLKADSMVGVPLALTGATNAIRGIPGGGIPWTLDSGKVVLATDGHLTVKVEGLVLAAGANAGSNPVNPFRAIVSCLRSDASIANVMTDAFPATTGPATAGGGNAKFEGAVALPQPCIAPIVFVTSGGGSWFASTGG
jgi:hypothetical protein